MDIWTEDDWTTSTALSHTNFNKLNAELRVVGYGKTPGSITKNFNLNHIAALGSIIQDNWTAAALTDWTNFGNGYPDMQYRLDKQRNLILMGSIAPGTKTDATTLFTLDSGFRPNSYRVLVCGIIGAPTVTCHLRFANTGQVQVFGLTGSPLGIHVYGSIPLD